MAKATWKLEVDWDNSGTFDGGGEDVSAQLLTADTFIGRDFPSQLTGNSVVGRLNAVLLDPDGTYARFNTSSPLSGSLLPNRKVQLSVTAPISTVVWVGFLDSIVPSKQHGGRQEALLSASGPFKVLDTPVSVGLQQSIRTDNAVATLLNAVDWNATARILATGQTAMTWWIVDGNNALGALRQVEATEAGFLRETRDGKVQFNDRHYRQSGTFTAPQATYSDSPTSTLRYEAIESVDALRQVYNDFRAQVQVFTTGAASSTLWKSPDAVVGTSAPLLTAGGTVSVWASYPNSTSTINAWGVASWLTPVATTDYNFFSDEDGTGTNLNAALKVTATKFSKSMKMEFENTGTADGYFTLMQTRGTPLARSEGVTVAAEDATSQTSYGPRRFPRPDAAQWVPTQEEAADWAKYNLAIFKDPRAVVSVTFNGLQGTDVQTEIFKRDIDDRVKVVATGSGVAGANFGLNEDFYVESIRHKVRRHGFDHEAVMELSAAAGFAGFWVLGSSTLGTATRLNY